MYWIIMLAIGVASSIDNFAIGLSYGTKGKKITAVANLFIALIAFVVSFLALIAGHWVSSILPNALPDIIGGLIILLIGVWSLADTLKRRQPIAMPEAEDVDWDQDNLIEAGEVFFLSIALSFNAIGTAFGAGMGGLSPWAVGGFIGAFSFLSIGAGQWLGLGSRRSVLGKSTEYLSAFLMIAIGLYTILTSIK